MGAPQAIIIALGAAGHVAALVVMLWAAFGDCARGRRRCPQCAYDMAGIAAGGGSRCPECGRAIPTEAVLVKTRRRWRVIAAMLLVQIGLGYYWWQDRPGRNGWPGLVPTAALIEGVDDPTRSSPLADALWARQADGQLTESQTRGIIRRIVERRTFRPSKYAWYTLIETDTLIDLVDDPQGSTPLASELWARARRLELSPAQRQRVAERMVDYWIASGGAQEVLTPPGVCLVGQPVTVRLDPRAVPAFGGWTSVRFEDGPSVVDSIGFSCAPESEYIHMQQMPPAPLVTLAPPHEGENRYRLRLRIEVRDMEVDLPRWTIVRTVDVDLIVIGSGTP